MRAQTPIFRLRETKELSDAYMTTVVQDSRGWIWFGAENRLYRYDGLSFQTVNLPDSVSGSVSALFEWDDRLWAGFRDGTIGYMPVSSAFTIEANGQKQNAARLQLWSPEEGRACPAVASSTRRLPS